VSESVDKHKIIEEIDKKFKPVLINKSAHNKEVTAEVII
jgi:hypothetical protein